MRPVRIAPLQTPFVAVFVGLAKGHMPATRTCEQPFWDYTLGKSRPFRFLGRNPQATTSLAKGRLLSFARLAALTP